MREQQFWHYFLIIFFSGDEKIEVSLEDELNLTGSNQTLCEYAVSSCNVIDGNEEDTEEQPICLVMQNK